ncbi:MAG: hypothetical protein MI923_02115 [Phycisphaerales bacterium]|nr:hypothetical protein [Phycisphaerales bacterium]
MNLPLGYAEMPLQFRCQACDQPIEVDDEAVGQMVICPFCRKLSQAPAFSDPTIHLKGPVAVPQGPSSEVVPVAQVSYPASPPSSGRNTLGWASLVAAGISVSCLIIAMMALMSTVGLVNPNATMADLESELQKAAENNAWILAVCFVASWLGPFMGIIFAIGGLVKGDEPRWPAIVGLVVSGGMILMSCGGAIFSLSIG